MSLRIGIGLAVTSHLKAGPFLPTRNKRLDLQSSLEAYTIGGATHVAGNKTDLRITDASQTGLDPLTNDWSLDFWVNFASVAAGETCFVHKGGNDNTTAGYEVYRNGTTLKAALSNGTTRVVVDLGTIAAATWYHGAVSFDRDGNAIGYLNAVVGTPADISGINTSINSSVDFYVGSRAGANYAGVSWSALRIWNKKLSAADVTSLYGNGNAQYYADLTSTVGLVSNYDPVEPFIGNPSYVTGASATCRDLHSTNNLTFTAATMSLNPGFETPGAGGDDVFANWSETKADGTIADETTIVHSGSHSCKITRNTGTPYVYQEVGSDGFIYRYSIWARGAVGGDVIVLLGGTSGTSGSITLTTSWQKVTCTGTGTYYRINVYGTSAVAYLDDAECYCTHLAACNGPSTAVASDSTGTKHGPLSGFSTTGEVFNWVVRGADYALYFDGTNDTVLCGNLGNVTRISFDVCCPVANQELLTLANSTATAVTVVAGTLTFGASLAASNITVDGVAKTAAQAGALINDGNWHTVAFDLTSVAASNVKLATDSSAFGNIYLDNVVFSLSGTVTHTYTFADGPHGTPSNGSPIVKWISQEGNVYGFDQPTLSKAPSYVVSAQHSRPGLYGDGIDDYLSGPLNVLTDVDTLSMAIICGPSAFDADQALWATSDTASATIYMEGGISAAGKAYLEWRSGGTTNRVTGNTVLAPSDDAVITWKWTGSAWSITVNRKVQTLTVSGSNTGKGPADLTGLDNFTLFAKVDSTGTVKPFEGTILDMLDYEIAETPLTIDRIQRVYQRKYAMGF